MENSVYRLNVITSRTCSPLLAVAAALLLATARDTSAQTNTVGSLRIESSRTDTSGTLNINPDMFGTAVRLGFASNITWLVTNAGTVVNVNGELANSVGNGTTNNGLIIAGGAVMNVSTNFYNGYDRARDTFLTVVGAGSQLNISNAGFFFHAYNSASTTLTLSNGGVLTTGKGRAGGAPQDIGTRVYITGTNSLWAFSSSGPLLFGYVTGTLLALSDGGALSAPNANVEFKGADPSGPSRLQGNGTVTARNLLFADRGRLTPEGTAPLIVNGNLSFGDASFFDWNLFTNSTSGPGTNFSAPVQLNGDINITAVNQASLAINFGAGVTDDPFWDTSRSWDLITTTTGNLDLGTRFGLSFTGNTNGITLSNFSLLSTNNALRLVYSSPDFYWNTNEVGLWSTGANWSANAVPGAANNAFINDGGTATVNAAASVNSVVIGSTNGSAGGNLTLSNGALTVSGGVSVAAAPGSTGTLNFNGGSLVSPTIFFGSGTGAVNFNQTSALSVTSAISGAGELRQLGAGTTTFNSVTNFGGSTLNISNGTVLITGSRFDRDIDLAAINVVGASSVLQTTTHALGGGTGGRMTPDIAITNGTWTLLNEQYVNSLTLNQARVNGTGELRADSDFSVLVTNGLSVWSAPLASVNSDGYFTVVSGATLEMTGRIGNYDLVKRGEGTMVLRGTNATYRETVIEGGTLSIEKPNSVSTNRVDFKNTGTLSFGNDMTFSNVINTLGSSMAGLFVDKLTTVVLTGGIFGTGNIDKTGAGLLVFSNANTYAGTTTISDGTISLAGTNGSLGVGAVTNNGILSIDRSNAMTLSNAMSGSGFLIKNGTATLTVTGDLLHTGGTEINAGTLRVGEGGSTGSLGTGGSIVNKGSLVFDRSDGGLVVSGNISGTGRVVQAGSGTTTLSGTNNTYSGATTVTNGVLRAGANGSFSPNTGFTLDGDGTIDLNGTTNETRYLEVRSGDHTQSGGSLILTKGDWSDTFRIGRDAGQSASYTLEDGYLGTTSAGQFQLGFNGTGVFNQNGGTNSISGYLVLGRYSPSGNGTYHLNGGLLEQSAANRLSIIGEDGTGEMNVNGGTYSNAGRIVIASTTNAVGTLNIRSNGVVIAPQVQFGSGNGLLNFDRDDAYTFAAPITGDGRVEKNGTGTVTFTNNNSYTRGTTVNAGELRVLGLANNASNTITVNNGGTLVFTRSDTFGNHSANVLTPIVINGGGLVKNSGNLINAVGPLTLNGGTLESTGVNNGISFALKGGVTVNSNSTLKGAGFALGSAAVNSATFEVAADAQLLVDGTLVDGVAPAWPTKQASSLVKSGDGTMTLAGDNTYSGTTTINAGTLQVGTNGTTGTLGTGEVENNGLLILNRSDALTVDNNISGTGSLTKQGDGTTTLTGENSYGGLTTVESGTLVLNGTHTNGLAYTVQTNAVFTGTGSTTSSVIVEGGGTITPGAAAGDVLTVGGLELNTGGTLNVFLNGASTSLLDVNGDVTLGGGVNFITGPDPLTASLYAFVTYTGTHSGEFGFTNTGGISGLPTDYGLFYGDDGKIFLRLTNVNVNVGVNYNEGNEVITGGTLPFEVAVVNESGSSITVTGTNGTNTTGSLTSTPVENLANTNLAGLSWSGTNVGTNSGSFDVSYDSGITNTIAVSVAVYDHAQGSLTTGNITNLNAIVGYTNPLSDTVTVSNASDFRVDLATASSSTNTNLTFEEAAGIGAGSSGNLTVNLANQAAGVFTHEVTVTFGDDSTLGGATNNLGTTNFTVSGTIFDHALGSVGTNAIVFAPVHSGYTAPLTNNTLTVSNSETSLRVDLGVANDNTDVSLLIDPLGGIAQSVSTNLAVVLNTGRGAGKFTNNVTLTFFDDSALAGASTNVGTAGIVISGYVYSGQGVWTNSGSGEWSSFDSWDVPGGTPGLDGALSVNDAATFGSGGSGAVILNTNASLLAVTFSNSASSYTVQGTGTLTLAESGDTAPSLTTAAGTHTISNAVAVVGDLQLETTGELLLAGDVSGGTLQHVGAGTTTLAGNNTFTNLGISNGQVILSNAAAAGTGAISLLAREEERVAVPQLVLGASGLTISNAIDLPTAALDPADPNRHLLMAAIEMTGGTNELTGAITGDGSLEVTGPGTMLITGTGNTYQGATRVSDGATLEVAAIDGTLGTGDDFYGYLDIVDATFRYTGGTTNTGRELYMNEGALSTIEVTDASANLTIDPTSPGELNVDFVKAGAGTLTFGAGAVYEGEANITVAGGTFVTEAENSYTGNTTISNAATFKLGGAGQLGSGDYAGNITNEGSFVLDTTADQTLSGVISGTGSLTQSNTGTLTVTGANTYTGTTTIATGSSLVLAGDGRLGTGEVINEGSFVVEPVGNQTLANTISGAGSVTKSGAGRLTASGANTYSGGTTLNAGTLVTTAPTSLGTGTVTLLGGTLELQSQLDIGSLFWDGAGKIAIPDPAGGSFVNVTSTLSLTNGVNFFDLSGATLTERVKLLAAPGVSTNAVSLFGVEGVDTNAFTYSLLYIGDELWLDLVPKPPVPAYPDFTQFALTPNQNQVAQALNQWVASGVSGDRQTVLDAATNSGNYPAAFEQMMPTPYASLPSMAFNTANALNSGMFQRLWVIRINGKGFSAGGMNLAPMQAEMGGTDDMGVFAISPSKDTKWGTFVDGNGIFANGGDVNYLQNYRSQSGGVSTGASYKWNDNLATGVYVGYQGLQAEYDNGRTIDNAVRFGVFGTYDIDNFYFNGLVGGAYHGYTINRNINFGGLERTATGRPGAGEFDLALGAGYDFEIGDFSWGPFTTMQYTYLGVQGFTETGAGALNLDVDPYNSSSLLYTLGAQAAYNWKISKDVIVTPTIFAGWQHEFLQDSYQINSSFNTGGPAAPFNYNTGTPARDNFYGGVGATLGIGDRWQATATYSSFVGGQNQNSQNLYLGLGYKF